MWEIITTHKIRARYRWRIVSWCQKCADESSPDIILKHGVRKCVFESTDFDSWLTILPMTNWTFTSSGTDTRTSPRISLCHSGFKGLAVSSVWGIVTFNNCQSYCLDSSWTLTFLTNSTTSPVFFPHQGGKYTAIHEIVANLDNSLSFSWVILVRGTQATQAKDTQVMLTHTKRQRKFELFNPSQASLRSSAG